MDFVAVPDRVQEMELERLMACYGSALLRMCYVYLKDAALAEDAVQDTFLKAYKRLHTLKDADSEQAWLMRIAINTCKDYLRTAWLRRVDRRIDIATLPEASHDPEMPDATVVEAVMALPRKYKDVVLLRYYQGMKIKDVADALGISMDAVKTRLRRANDTLRQKLERWYYDE
ncbi:MAG: sigma-70 family RNA polymerase sigma factor [Christensenellales bacterium]|jgi:RNA polymerase sigma factor (sigma-70 family)